jgi:CRISPR/Cas system-associated exonuclease Cas4 (RecB family)
MAAAKRPLSASQLSTWLACGRKYAFRYAYRLSPEHRPAALAFGSAVHSALEALHLVRLDGDQTTDPTQFVRVFRADWQAEVDTQLSFKEGDSPEHLRALGEQLVAAYMHWLADRPIVAAEQPFEIDLIDPETGEVSGERMRGYFDVIFPDDVVVEVKTAARRFDEGTIARKIQFSAYAYAWRQMRGRDPTVLVVSLLKQKRPDVVESIALRTKEDDAFFFHLALDVADAIDQRCFPPNPGFMCSDCEYGKACKRFRGADQPELLRVPPAKIAGMVTIGSLIPQIFAEARQSAVR